MILTNSILEDVREAVGLGRTISDFDTELLMHINSAIATLNQNGIGNEMVVEDSASTWGDLQSESQSEHNNYFKSVPLFVSLSTKLLFDPPPPSSVQYHQSNIDSILWRLKIAYEETTTT